MTVHTGANMCNGFRYRVSSVFTWRLAAPRQIREGRWDYHNKMPGILIVKLWIEDITQSSLPITEFSSSHGEHNSGKVNPYLVGDRIAVYCLAVSL